MFSGCTGRLFAEGVATCLEFNLRGSSRPTLELPSILSIKSPWQFIILANLFISRGPVC